MKLDVKFINFRFLNALSFGLAQNIRLLNPERKKLETKPVIGVNRFERLPEPVRIGRSNYTDLRNLIEKADGNNASEKKKRKNHTLRS